VKPWIQTPVLPKEQRINKIKEGSKRVENKRETELAMK
jgi:hypothetical protein